MPEQSGGGSKEAVLSDQDASLDNPLLLNEEVRVDTEPNVFFPCLDDSFKNACIEVTAMHLANLLKPVKDRTHYVHSIELRMKEQLQRLLDVVVESDSFASKAARVTFVVKALNVIGLSAMSLRRAANGRVSSDIEKVSSDIEAAIEFTKLNLSAVTITGGTKNCYEFTYNTLGVLTATYAAKNSNSMLLRGAVMILRGEGIHLLRTHPKTMYGSNKFTVVTDGVPDFNQSFPPHDLEESLVPKWDGNMLRFIYISQDGSDNQLLIMGKKTPYALVDLPANTLTPEKMGDLIDQIKGKLKVPDGMPVTGLLDVLKFVIATKRTVECELMFHEVMGQGFQRSQEIRLLIPHDLSICNDLVREPSVSGAFAHALGRVIGAHTVWESGEINGGDAHNFWGDFIALLKPDDPVERNRLLATIPLFQEAQIKRIFMSLVYLLRVESFPSLYKARTLAQVLFPMLAGLGHVTKGSDIRGLIDDQFSTDATKFFTFMKDKRRLSLLKEYCKDAISAFLFAYASIPHDIITGFERELSVAEGVLIKSSNGSIMRFKLPLWNLILKKIMNGEELYSPVLTPNKREERLKAVWGEVDCLAAAIKRFFPLFGLDPNGAFSGREYLSDLMTRFFQVANVDLSGMPNGQFPQFEDLRRAFLRKLSEHRRKQVFSPKIKLILTSSTLAEASHDSLQELRLRYGQVRDQVLVLASSGDKKDRLIKQYGWPEGSIFDLSQLYQEQGLELPTGFNNFASGVALSAMLSKQLWNKSPNQAVPLIVCESRTPRRDEVDFIHIEKSGAAFQDSMESAFRDSGILPAAQHVAGSVESKESVEAVIALSLDGKIDSITAGLRSFDWSNFFEVTCVSKGKRYSIADTLRRLDSSLSLGASAEEPLLGDLLKSVIASFEDEGERSSFSQKLIGACVRVLSEVMVPVYGYNEKPNYKEGFFPKKVKQINPDSDAVEMRELKSSERLTVLIFIMKSIGLNVGDCDEDTVSFIATNLDKMIQWCKSFESGKNASFYPSNLSRLLHTVSELITCSSGSCLAAYKQLRLGIDATLSLAISYNDKLKKKKKSSNSNKCSPVGEAVVPFFRSLLGCCVSKSDYSYLVSAFKELLMSFAKDLLSDVSEKGLLNDSDNPLVFSFIEKQVHSMGLPQVVEILKSKIDAIWNSSDKDLINSYKKFLTFFSNELKKVIGKMPNSHTTMATLNQVPSLCRRFSDDAHFGALCSAIIGALSGLFAEQKTSSTGISVKWRLAANIYLSKLATVPAEKLHPCSPDLRGFLVQVRSSLDDSTVAMVEQALDKAEEGVVALPKPASGLSTNLFHNPQVGSTKDVITNGYRECGVALVLCQGRVLMCSKAGGDNPTDWQLPGGGRKEGESFFDAARRELCEETTLKPENLEQLESPDGVSENKYDLPIPGSIQGQVQQVFFFQLKEGVDTHGTQPNDNELAQLVWVPISEAVRKAEKSRRPWYATFIQEKKLSALEPKASSAAAPVAC